ncbi:MAG: hypothetical protein JXR44_09700 [Thiotrichales bacterium]|nr:hypothetical protein [Thiotrichales bacterium]
MRQFIYVGFLSSVCLGWGLSLPAAASLQQINQLEQRLFTEGESAELYLALAQAYAQSGDLASAQAYLQLIEQTWPNLPEPLQKEVQSLVQQLTAFAQAQTADTQKWMWVLEGGYETNANRGTELDFLSFSLDNGEAFFLNLDSQTQQRESAFGTATLLHHYLPENQNWMLSTALETTQYQAPDLKSSLLLRTSLRWQTQSLTLYRYENSRNLNGVLYSGQYQPFDWALRRQNDRQVANFGVSSLLPIGNSMQQFSVSLGWDQPLETRAGGINDSLRFRYQLLQNALRLTYQFEYGRDREAYNPFFYQQKHDTYHWHSLSLEYALYQTSEQRLSLKLQYDDKDHKIDLNSWQNHTVALSWARLF